MPPRLLSRLVLASSIAIFSATSASAQAPGAREKRFMCGGLPPNEKTGECDAEHWTDATHAVIRIHALLLMREHEYLERTLAINVDAARLRPNGWPASADVGQAIERMFPDGDPKGESRALVEAWKAAMPDSTFVPLFEAIYWIQSAWAARGSGYASSVSKEGWILFEERLAKSERTLAEAPRSLKATALWHQYRLHVALDKNGTAQSTLAVFREGTMAHPAYVPLYHYMAQRLVPKWGGNYADLETFVETSTRNSQAQLGRSLYAWLYVLLAGDNAPGVTKMSWPKARESFRDLTKRYEAPQWPEMYASFACWARDRNAFDEALALARRPLDSRSWLPGHGPDACLLWAGRKNT